MMGSLRCAKCNDNRFVLKDGVAVKCGCYVERMLLRNCERAGVPTSLSLVPAKDLFTRLERCLEQPFDIDVASLASPTSWLVVGSVTSELLVVARYCALVRAIEQGETAASLTLHDAVDAKFDAAAKVELDAKLNAKALLVDLSGIDHKFAKDALRLIYARRQFGPPSVTVWAFNVSPVGHPSRFGADFAGAMKRVDVVIDTIDSFNESNERPSGRRKVKRA